MNCLLPHDYRNGFPTRRVLDLERTARTPPAALSERPGPHRKRSDIMLWLSRLAGLVHRHDDPECRCPRISAVADNPFPYNDPNALEELLQRHSGDVAAIIMEPMGIVEPLDGYLDSVRYLSRQHEAVLIFDECWTGFRIDPMGAYGRFGVAPDIACFGKSARKWCANFGGSGAAILWRCLKRRSFHSRSVAT